MEKNDVQWYDLLLLLNWTHHYEKIVFSDSQNRRITESKIYFGQRFPCFANSRLDVYFLFVRPYRKRMSQKTGVAKG